MVEGVAVGEARPVTETMVPTTGERSEGSMFLRAACRAATKAAVLGERLPLKRLVEAMVWDWEGLSTNCEDTKEEARKQC